MILEVVMIKDNKKYKNSFLKSILDYMCLVSPVIQFFWWCVT